MGATGWVVFLKLMPLWRGVRYQKTKPQWPPTHGRSSGVSCVLGPWGRSITGCDDAFGLKKQKIGS